MPSPRCVSSLSRKTRISALFVQNLASLSLGITRTVFGKRARSLPLSFVRILSISSQAWPSLLAVHFIRATARTRSVKAFFLQKKLQSFVCLAVIRRPLLMNIGCSSGLSMGFAAALVTGMTKLMQSFARSVLPHPSKTPVSTQDLSAISQILHPLCSLPHCHLVCMSTTLLISPKTRRLRHYSVASLPSDAKLILWGLMSGSLAFTSCGKSRLPWWPSISISLVLLLTLSRILLANPNMRHPLQHPIVLAFQSIPLRPPPTRMTLLRRYVKRRLIRASLAASVGCRLLHVLTSLWHTPSYHLTLISLHLGT